MDFYSAYRHGFVRVAACTHHTTLADPATNAQSVVRLARDCHDEAVALAVFPELTLSGYSIEDILLSDTLLESVTEALASIVEASVELLPVLVVGAPLRHRHRIYNTAVVIHHGSILGVVPKSYLPTYREFYESRQVAAADARSNRGPGDDITGTIRVNGVDVPFGSDLLFAAADLPNFVLHVEICEDMWVPVPPSATAALGGATVLANLSGSPITIGRADDRKLLARSASSRCLAAYVYSAAGEGESTTDLAWDGQTMIYENGVLLAESERFPRGERRSVADVDTELLAAGYTLAHDQHVRVDVFWRRFSTTTRCLIDIAFLLPLLAVCVHLATGYWGFWLASAAQGEGPEDVLTGLERWPIKLALFAGFSLLALQCASELLKRWAVLRGWLPEAVPWKA